MPKPACVNYTKSPLAVFKMVIPVKKTLLITSFLLLGVRLTFSSTNYRKDPQDGTLLGDVQNWAALIQNYIRQVSFT
jgi:hypothetical protein